MTLSLAQSLCNFNPIAYNMQIAYNMHIILVCKSGVKNGPSRSMESVVDFQPSWSTFIKKREKHRLGV